MPLVGSFGPSALPSSLDECLAAPVTLWLLLLQLQLIKGFVRAMQ
jgi:hypothetical protein